MSKDSDDFNPFIPGAPKPQADGGDVRLSWSSLSTSGARKPVNDDSRLNFAVAPAGSTALADDDSRSLAREDLIFAISDGMGGGRAGDVASQLLLTTLGEIIPETFKRAAAGMYPDYLGQLEALVQKVHRAINQDASQDSRKKGMAATLALTWFTPENLYLCNVGDSRIYRHRDGETLQLSKDHSLAWGQLKRGQITERQFRTHPRRAALYQVIGGGHNTVIPHIDSTPYRNGDVFLICSDGVIDGLWNKQIHQELQENLFSTSSAAEALMRRAIANAGSDDTTLTVIRVEQKSADKGA